MAPAPVRPSRPRAGGSWGIPVGATLMVVGVVTAIVIVAVGVISFIRDVDRLVRTGSGGDLVTDLEAGEYFLYDEDDGVDLGPLDVRVTRVSDGLGVGTTDVDDGPSYDIGGNSGSAALSFDLPSAGDYRIETTTGVGEIASFAVGRDVGAGPFASLTRGLLIGGLLFGLGLVLLIWGVVQRGRAHLRSRAEAALDQGRRAVESTAGSIDDPDQRRHVATRHGRRISQTAAERADAAPAPLRGELDRAAAAAESAVGDLAASAEAPSELLGRLGDSLGRAQERLGAGESLRDVARDGVGELRSIGTDARREAAATHAAATGAAAGVAAEAESRRSDLLAAREDMVAAAGAEADEALAAAERVGEETSAEIGAALDTAAADLTAAALRSAGNVNDEAKAAIDRASAELRAASGASSLPPPTPGEAVGSSLPAPEPPPPPPPPPTPAAPGPRPTTTGAAGVPSPAADQRAGVDDPVPLAPPPSARPPSTGPETAPARSGFEADRPRSAAVFVGLAPPPTALRGAPDPRREGVPADAARPAPLGPPVLAPPPSGRRPGPGPGPAEPPG